MACSSTNYSQLVSEEVIRKECSTTYRIPERLHDDNTASRSQVETETTALQAT